MSFYIFSCFCSDIRSGLAGRNQFDANSAAAAAEQQRFSDLQEELGFVEPTFQRSLMGRQLFSPRSAFAIPQHFRLCVNGIIIFGPIAHLYPDLTFSRGRNLLK